jgi:hypothetical protein
VSAQASSTGRGLIELCFFGGREQVVDATLEILDVVAAERDCATADQDCPAPFWLALAVAGQPTEKVFAQPDVGPWPDYQGGGQGAFPAGAGSRLLKLGAREDVDAWHPAPLLVRVEMTRCLLHYQRRIPADASLGNGMTVERVHGNSECAALPALLLGILFQAGLPRGGNARRAGIPGCLPAAISGL